MLYHLDFCLLMLRRRLVRTIGFRSKEDTAALHANVAELSWKKGDIAQDNLRLVRNIKQGMLQLGEGHLTSQAMHEVPHSSEKQQLDMVLGMKQGCNL